MCVSGGGWETGWGVLVEEVGRCVGEVTFIAPRHATHALGCCCGKAASIPGGWGGGRRRKRVSGGVSVAAVLTAQRPNPNQPRPENGDALAFLRGAHP